MAPMLMPGNPGCRTPRRRAIDGADAAPRRCSTPIAGCRRQRRCCDRLHDADGVHLVGGAVRDLLRGAAPPTWTSWSTASSARGRSLRSARSRCPRPVRDRHRRARRRSATTSPALAASAIPHPGALPEVEPPGPRRGSASAATSPSTRSRSRWAATTRGTLLAVDEPATDLDGRRLRVLHDASFSDDPTRLLRLARYAARLAFAVEPHTLDLAARPCAGGALETVSGARVGHRAAAAGRRARSGGGIRAAARAGDRRGARARVRAVRSRARRAGRWRCCPPTATGRRWCWRPRRLRVPGRSWPRCLTRLAFDGRATRDAIVAAADRRHAHWRARSTARRAPVGDRRRVGGVREPELVALAGALGPAQAGARVAGLAAARVGSRSTATTCWRPGCPRPGDRRGAARRRWRPSSTAAPPAARPSSPSRSERRRGSG